MTKKHRVFGIAADPKLEGYAVLAWDTGADQKSLCDALARGHFLVTKGARVAGLEVTSRAVEIGIDDWHPTTDHVDFIGAGGALLARVVSNPARYELRGGEGYVRAHVFQDRLEGSEKPRREAWTQAFFIR